MTVDVEYNDRTGQWDVIETVETGTGFGWQHSKSGSYSTRNAAVDAARRVARDGEKIVLKNTEGKREMIRQGEFLPG